MLANNYRFHGHGSLRYVFQKGSPRRSRHLLVRFIKNPRRTHPRFSVVVSKKVYKSAVKRNRIRRRVYDIVRHSITNTTPSYDVVITVFSPDILTLEHSVLAEDLRTLLSFLGDTPDTPQET